MQNIVDWCNANEGFTNILLSIISAIFSVIAIIVSIQTARLPYKRKVKISAATRLLFAIGSSKVSRSVAGLSINVLNLGNRDIYICYLGYAVKIEHKYQTAYKLSDEMTGIGILHPSEIHSNTFSYVDIINSFSKIENGTKVYAYAEDSEGHIYKKYIDTAGNITKNIRSMVSQ